MTQILLINPNTNAQITEDLHLLAESVCGERARVVSVTAAFGASYIMDHASAVIAGHAVLDSYAEALKEDTVADAAIIACFGDPGFEALAQVAEIPVVGFAESGIRAAAKASGTFLVATRGEFWRDILRALVWRLDLSSRLAGIVEIPGDMTDPIALARTIEQAAARTGAARIVVGGASLRHLIPYVTEASRLPIIDAHRAAICEAVDRAAETRCTHPPTSSGIAGFGGLSPALTSLLNSNGHRRLT